MKILSFALLSAAVWVFVIAFSGCRSLDKKIIQMSFKKTVDLDPRHYAVAQSEAEPLTYVTPQLSTLNPQPVYHLPRFACSLPAETSNLSEWDVMASDTAAGPFQWFAFLTTNYFETSARGNQYFFFYGVND